MPAHVQRESGREQSLSPREHQSYEIRVPLYRPYLILILSLKFLSPNTVSLGIKEDTVHSSNNEGKESVE